MKSVIMTLAALLLIALTLGSSSCKKEEEDVPGDNENPEYNGSFPELFYALTALNDHIKGGTHLEPGQIHGHRVTIDSQSEYLGQDSTIIKACFDLVESYDNIRGPLWIARGPLNRESFTSSIDWIVYNVMQSIMDRVYTQENILVHEALIDGFKFGSSAHFPGALDPPDNKDETYTVKIDGSYLKTYGHLTMHAERPARKPTGAYLAPGSIATLTVPPSLAGAGYQIRIGAHSWDMSNRPTVKRLDRSTLLYDINSTEIKVASPLGGGIYIEVPYLADAGIVDVKIKNAVRSPYFSLKSFHKTSLSQWQNVESKHKAPWADFQSDKFMMQVPGNWVNQLQDPLALMEKWDAAMDVMNDLMGFPHVRGKETMYPQVDVIFRVPYHAPGYPSINATYDPNRNYSGYHNYHLVTGPQNALYYEFHEQGHAYLFTKFPGETESNVNLLHVAVWHQKFGYSLDEAFRNSMDKDMAYRTLDNTALCWMMCQNFKEKKRMDKLEKQYQLKGHAKFVEIARLFGWEVLGDYWKSFNEDYENGISSATGIDKLLLRLSESVGVDITSLFHFWGVPPMDPGALKIEIESENLPASAKIYDTLVKYKSLVPDNLEGYQDFANGWWGHQPSGSGYITEQNHATLWSTYDEDYALLIRNNVQEILDLYFPNGRPQ
ncbi:MAG: hypothetical protein GY790_14195 [Bacteroidetes bacterium]|nr:hypothetical protein [Bacteroidota bacterium]